MSVLCKKSSPPPPWRQCFSMDKNFTNNFLKGSPKEHSCEIISKSDYFRKEDFLRISSCPYSAKSLPPMAAMFFDRSKFLRTFFKKGQPRSNPVKLFQNLARGFRGEEFKNFEEFL